MKSRPPSVGGPHSFCSEDCVGITAAEVQCVDPERVAARWSSILDRTVELRDREIVITLANADVRFVAATDGRGEGLSGIGLRVARSTGPPERRMNPRWLRRPQDLPRSERARRRRSPRNVPRR